MILEAHCPLQTSLKCMNYVTQCLTMLTIFIFDIYFKVASKGAGLNPNAKVWQEIPQGNTEVSQTVNGTEDSWDEASSAAESHAEGMFVRIRSCSLPTKCVATYLWHIVLSLHVFITRGNIKIKPWPFKTIWSYMCFF